MRLFTADAPTCPIFFSLAAPPHPTCPAQRRSPPIVSAAVSPPPRGLRWLCPCLDSQPWPPASAPCRRRRRRRVCRCPGPGPLPRPAPAVRWPGSAARWAEALQVGRGCRKPWPLPWPEPWLQPWLQPWLLPWPPSRHSSRSAPPAPPSRRPSRGCPLVCQGCQQHLCHLRRSSSVAARSRLRASSAARRSRRGRCSGPDHAPCCHRCSEHRAMPGHPTACGRTLPCQPGKLPSARSNLCRPWRCCRRPPPTAPSAPPRRRPRPRP
mmetsp:Transcript_84274/g.236917  ORF Transcript_84274/g.236917 Transcript_84274/m.236917 type:complete len:266 (+) Transcript_84274:12-809(+)